MYREAFFASFFGLKYHKIVVNEFLFESIMQSHNVDFIQHMSKI